MDTVQIKLFATTMIVFLLKFFLIIVFFLFGWLLAYLFRNLTDWLIKKSNLDNFCEKVGISEFLKKGQVTYTPGKLIGVVVFWVIMIIFILLGINMMGGNVSEMVFDRVEGIIPDLIGGLFIFVVGSLLIIFIGNFVQTLASNANFIQAPLLGKSIKSIGIIFLAVLILDYLGIGEKTIVFAFQTIFAGIIFATAIAFGMGCKDIVKENVEQLIKNIRDRNQPKGPDLEG
ncbi:MAG: hypothetical protein NC907_01250 [Candidatus Omnitrophica bacterium]|nr:hypothetical protein [Candidatus Omnitrophota bacterium]